jgi:hypothetical protein
VFDSDERERESVREPSLSGGQLCRVSPGRQSELRVAGLGFVFDPDSARRIVPLLLELF